MEAENFSAQ